MVAKSSPSGRVRLPICIDRYVATVDAPAQLADGVRHLLVDQLRAHSEPVGHLVVIAEDETISVDGRRWDPGADQTIFDQLLYVLMQSSLDDDPDRLHLHASLVGLGGRGLLIAGPSGSGKSTLVAELVAGGFDYFTDERVALDMNLALAPLPKPISIAHGAGGPLEPLARRILPGDAVGRRLWHLPASAVRAGSMGLPTPDLGAIVLVEFREGAALAATAMHPVTVARVLLEDCIDADRYGAYGPMLVTRLCASVPCFGVTHGGGGEVLAFARAALVERVEDPPSAVEPIVGGDRPAWEGAVRLSPESMVGRARGISGALLSDRALVRNGRGDLLELDETLTAWLMLLDATLPLGSIISEVAESAGVDRASLAVSAVAIVEHLASLGVAA